MTMNVRVFLTIFILSQVACSALGGADSSGGGSKITDERNPWFLGPSPIEYCLNLASDFPVAEDVVDRLIQEAFAKWKRVFVKLGFHGKDFPGKFHDGIGRGIVTATKRVDTCTDKDHQLEFKIGVVDEEVQEYFKTRSRMTVGYAYRKDYDHQTFRSGGYIWVSPNNWIGEVTIPFQNKTVKKFPVWENMNRLDVILIHEIGHVLGVPHLTGTAMTEGIYDLIFYSHVKPLHHEMRPLQTTIENYSFQIDSFLRSMRVVDTSQARVGNQLLELFEPSSKKGTWKSTEYRVTTDYDVRYPDGKSVGYGGRFEIRVRTSTGETYLAKMEGIFSIQSNDRSIAFYSHNYKNDDLNSHWQNIYHFHNRTSSFSGKMQFGEKERLVVFSLDSGRSSYKVYSGVKQEIDTDLSGWVYDSTVKPPKPWVVGGYGG